MAALKSVYTILREYYAAARTAARSATLHMPLSLALPPSHLELQILTRFWDITRYISMGTSNWNALSADFRTGPCSTYLIVCILFYAIAHHICYSIGRLKADVGVPPRKPFAPGTPSERERERAPSLPLLLLPL